MSQLNFNGDLECARNCNTHVSMTFLTDNGADYCHLLYSIFIQGSEKVVRDSQVARELGQVCGCPNVQVGSERQSPSTRRLLVMSVGELKSARKAHEVLFDILAAAVSLLFVQFD